MARQEVSRTTHIEEGELRVTHENAILTNITKTMSDLVNRSVTLAATAGAGKFFKSRAKIVAVLNWKAK